MMSRVQKYIFYRRAMYATECGTVENALRRTLRLDKHRRLSRDSTLNLHPSSRPFALSSLLGFGLQGSPLRSDVARR